MWSRCIRPISRHSRFAASVAGGAAAQDTVKVGMVMPMTGTLAAAGQQVVAGARLYMQQHGDTVAGKRIELIVKDDASSVRDRQAPHSGARSSTTKSTSSAAA